jgi:hypothetical protein
MAAKREVESYKPDTLDLDLAMRREIGTGMRLFDPLGYSNGYTRKGARSYLIILIKEDSCVRR